MCCAWALSGNVMECISVALEQKEAAWYVLCMLFDKKLNGSRLYVLHDKVVLKWTSTTTLGQHP